MDNRKINNKIDYDDYLNQISWKYKHLVIDLWNKLNEIVTNIIPPQSGQSYDGKSFFLCWSKNEHYLDIDLFADGSLEWFYRNRTTQECSGTEEPVKSIDGQIIQYLELCAIE